MKFVLKKLRSVRSFRRRLKTYQASHWARDLYTILAIFPKMLQEIAALIPTLAIVLLAPAHFFSRLPSYLKDRRSGVKWAYKTPLDFAWRVIALILTALGISQASLHLSGLGYEFLRIGLGLGTIVTLPIVLPIVCLMLWSFYAPIRWIAIKWFDDEILPKNPVVSLQIPVDFRTYQSIKAQTFLWGLFYYFGYVCSLGSILMIVLLILGILLTGILHWFATLVHLNVLQESIYVATLIGSLIVATDLILVRPYVELLVASSIQPTTLMFRMKTLDLECSLERMLSFASRTPLRRRLRHDADTQAIVEERSVLSSRIQSLLNAFRKARIKLEQFARRHRANDVTLTLSMGHFLWRDIAAELARLPFEYADRVQLSKVLSNFIDDKAVLAFFNAPVPYYAEAGALAHTDESRTEQRSREERVFDALLDATEQSGKLLQGVDDLGDHYKSLLEETLRKELLAAWIEVDDRSTRLRDGLSSISQLCENLRRLDLDPYSYPVLVKIIRVMEITAPGQASLIDPCT